MTKALTQVEESGLTPADTIRRVTRTPAVDIGENEHEYVIMADMPGLEHNDIDVQMSDQKIEIRALLSRPEDKENSPAQMTEYQRSFNVEGCRIDANAISAEYIDGTLVVRMPKSEEALPKKISIKKVG